MIRTALISFLTNSLNTRTLSSYLKANGYEVVCLFCPRPFNESNLEELVKILKENKITLVGVSLVTDDYQSAVLVTKVIKDQMSIPVIWGGAHVNVKPEESLKYADMICRGEGEEALLELVDGMSKNLKSLTSIKNIWFKQGNTIIRNELRNLEEKLDKYPYPDFNLETQYVMNEKGFEHLNEKHLNGEYSVMTSRGCPYSCYYCYNNYRRKHYTGKGTYLRTRSIENVIGELIKAKQIFKNLNKINFWDDSFVSRRISDFEAFKILYVNQVQLPFFALIEPMAFNYDKIKILKECGLNALQIGIQSGSERVNREIYHRNVTNQKVLEMAGFIHDLKINVLYDLIFNNPYETKDDLIETIQFLLQFPRPFSLQGYNLIFYPGTEITDNALCDGYILEKPDEDDFSTIESYLDSPISMKGTAEVSSRFYSICYDSQEKAYFNTIISLIASRHFPRTIIRYFAASETSLKKVLLPYFVGLYTLAANLKTMITRR